MERDEEYGARADGPGEEPDPDRERPDLGDGDPVEHLWNAAHEMLRAFRTLLDAADEFVESQRGRGSARAGADPRESRVHHIDIDLGTDTDLHTDRHTDLYADVEASEPQAPGSGSGPE